MRPKYRHWLSPSLWQLNGDLHLTDWLEEKNIEFDVHTDEDLHREGVGLLNRYQVVLTGSHPEYTSEKMYAASAPQTAQSLLYRANRRRLCVVVQRIFRSSARRVP